ncbi:hypothetical protein VT84_25335 [Gemmata sp. SH-PL17]|uniref:hypothetical protein n=1 Tax=Gemmata sp. SH-PL17 TaxID=1630693 RepID=UPI0004B76BF4|nr:hypothetical protein [Gemmata sp. SH-PL17]AMV27750.1 hypothetical protein VT84_25335 [Gemmata sp. SH-PL17]
MRTLLASVLVIALNAGSVGAADETYTIKLYESKKGDKSATEKSEGAKVVLFIDTADMNDKDDAVIDSRESYTEEILEKKAGDSRATKLLRKYTVAEKTVKGETTKAVFAGKSVLIEDKGDAYQFSVDGKVLEERDAPELYKSFKKNNRPNPREFIPKEAVKIGADWKVPAAESAKMFKALNDDRMKIDVEKSTIEGKLVKAYKRGGAQLGVIELTITVAVTEIDLNGQSFKTTADSKVVLKGTLDTCIDGTIDFEESKAETTIDITAELPDSGSLTLQSTITNAVKVNALKK